MAETQKRNLQRARIVVLSLAAAVLAVLMYRDSLDTAYRVQKTITLTSDTNGIPIYHGVALQSPFLRQSLFRMFSLLDYDVELSAPKGWTRNPTMKSNVWSASEDLNRLGISPAARALRERDKTGIGQAPSIVLQSRDHP